MRALAIRDFQGIDGLGPIELPRPVPVEGEILIRVHFAGVNPVDWKIEEGLLKERLPHVFPVVPGWDVAGVVEDVGRGVDGFAENDPVHAYIRRDFVQHGGYCEFVAFPAADVAPAPARLTLAEAAAVPLAGLTAWQALLEHVHLERGQTILIQAGAGGVGSWALQIAKYLGATVLTTASPENHGYVQWLGADEVIDYTRHDFVEAVRERYPDGIDAVFDLVGGDTQQRAWDVLREGGIQVSIVSPPPEDEAARRGVRAGYCFVRPEGGQLREIDRLLETGVLRPPKVEVLPLEAAREAQRRSQAGHVRGKLVLRVVS